MYERFTDRARKVMQLANAEARRLNHEYIGTEHILLGIIEEGSGVAANVIQNLGIMLPSLRVEVEKARSHAPKREQENAGFCGLLSRLCSMLFGRSTPSPQWPKFAQTPTAKKVVQNAMHEAIGLGHNYVGTEHLLLGLLREPESVAFEVLTNLGLELHDVREGILDLLGQSSSDSD